jgi:ankyrin repeat protein
MSTFIQTCTLDEAKLVLNETNLSIRCHPDLSLLHVAAIAGNILIAKYLVEKGLNVEDSTCFELTPVYMAAINGKTEMVRYLVEEHRANIHIKNMFGETIMDAINHQKHPQTVRYLQELRVVRADPGEFLAVDREKCYKVLERLGVSLITTVPRLPPLGSVGSLR